MDVNMNITRITRAPAPARAPAQTPPAQRTAMPRPVAMSVAAEVSISAPRPVDLVVRPADTAPIRPVETAARPTEPPTVRRDRRDRDDDGYTLMREVVQEANRQLIPVNRALSISVHEGTNRIVAKVIDTETDEIVREIPPERMLDLLAKVKELAGLLVDEAQ